MATTIHSLAYKISADSAGFTKGIAATRKELTSAKRIIRETERPIDKYKRSVREADTLLRKGSITQEQYNRNLTNLKTKLGTVRGPMATFQKGLTAIKGGVGGIASALGPAGLAISAFAATFSAGAMRAARFTFEKISTAMEKLDRVGKLSAAIGIDGQELRRIQLATATISGVDGERTGKALQFMVNAVSEAAVGLGEGQLAIEELGLSAERLNLRSPAEQFKTIADAVANLTNKNDQARIAQDLFGRGGKELIATLRGGRGPIEDLGKTFDEFAGKLSSLDFKRIESLNDALGLTKLAQEGLWDELTAEFSVPALAIVRELNKQIKTLRGQTGTGTRGTVGLAVGTSLQETGGVITKQGAQTFGGAPALAAVNALLARFPSLVDVVVRSNEEQARQAVQLNANVVSGLSRVEAAARDAAVAVELPPGSNQ